MNKPSHIDKVAAIVNILPIVEEAEQRFSEFLGELVAQSCIVEDDMCNYDLTERQALGFADIEKLEDGWNSYPNCKAPSEKVIHKAKRLCGFLGNDCEIEPASNGDIHLFCEGVEYTVGEE